jgi:L,D-transpeptidase YbiS
MQKRSSKYGGLYFWVTYIIGTFIFLVTLSPQVHAPAVVISAKNSSALIRSEIAHISALKKEINAYNIRVRNLKQLFQKLQPKKPFLVVNTSGNEVRLMGANHLIHKGNCSTGSYILLRAIKEQRQWLFKTPRGMYRVTVKLRDPWWYKPDWAYIEEGLPIPSIYSPKRYQPGVLGDYALGFGHGYLVHGTLYKRFLGWPVTHGCVRLGDEDMQLVFKTLTHGSRIYIY